jgi:TPR repeat protein
MRGGDGCEQDLAEAESLLRDSARAGNDTAQLALYTMLLHGQHGAEKNLIEADKWLQRAKDGGSADAQYQIGLNYMDGVEAGRLVFRV